MQTPFMKYLSSVKKNTFITNIFSEIDSALKKIEYVLTNVIILLYTNDIQIIEFFTTESNLKFGCFQGKVFLDGTFEN